MSFYLGLKNCCCSIYPRGICSNVIPEAYLYAEGSIVFTFHFVCKALIRVNKIVSSAVQIFGLEYCLLSNALFRASVLFPQMSSYLGLNYVYSEYPRGVCIIFILAAYLYAEGCIVSLFPSSIMLVLRSTVKSPQQYWYLGLGYCLLGNALICSFVLSPKVSSYQRLKNCRRSISPLGICSIVIPAAYLNAEGCIVFTFHFISKPHISVYNIVSSAMLISGL